MSLDERILQPLVSVLETTLVACLQEARVVERVRLKAATFGQDIDMEGAVKDTHYKVKPEVVAALYRDAVMPMTKRVQVAYLLRRLD